MHRSRCRYCGASRKVLENACPYCGRAYDDSFDPKAGTYEDIRDRRGVLFASSAAKRWFLTSHTNCRLTITQDQFIFEDFEDKTYSFTIPMEELKKAKMQNPRGWLSSSDDMLIVLEDGTEYEIGLDSGVKSRVLEILKAIWETYP